MKDFLLFPSFLSLVIVSTLLSSCSPKYGAYFQNTSEDTPHYVKNETVTEPLIVSTQAEATVPDKFIEKPDEALVASVSPAEVKSDKSIEHEIEQQANQLVLVNKQDRNGHMTKREEMILDALKIQMKEMTKKEKREFKHEVLKYAKEENLEKLNTADNLLAPYDADEPDTNTLLLVILAVLLPPLAVGLHEGRLNGTFWLNLLLTLLFYVPGLIHALIVILR